MGIKFSLCFIWTNNQIFWLQSFFWSKISIQFEQNESRTIKIQFNLPFFSNTKLQPCSVWCSLLIMESKKRFDVCSFWKRQNHAKIRPDGGVVKSSDFPRTPPIDTLNFFSSMKSEHQIEHRCGFFSLSWFIEIPCRNWINLKDFVSKKF